MLTQGTDKLYQVLRYGMNGVLATAVHFGVLALLIEGLTFSSAALANVFAASVGITVSFFGNRYFVFKSTVESVFRQARRFGLLYVAIAFVHAGLMFIVSDIGGFSYQVGFAAATVVQFVLSYFGNRFLVFQ